MRIMLGVCIVETSMTLAIAASASPASISRFHTASVPAATAALTTIVLVNNRCPFKVDRSPAYFAVALVDTQHETMRRSMGFNLNMLHTVHSVPSNSDRNMLQTIWVKWHNTATAIVTRECRAQNAGSLFVRRRYYLHRHLCQLID